MPVKVASTWKFLPPPRPFPAPLALRGFLLLLSPAAWGAARSWYYDLPLAALLTASLWAWAELIRRPRATAFLAACVLPALAELTKWEAVLFAAPLFVAILPVAWVLPDPRGEAPDRALRLRRLGALLGSLCLAVGSVTLAVQGLRGSFGSRLGGLLNVNPESSREGGSILSSLL